MTDSASSPERRPRLALRFSLRMLLAAFTAFAIGFPVWYRWPYERSEAVGSIPNQYRTITWQRQWRGGRLRHGPTRVVLATQLVALETYRNGVLNGPYEDHWSDGTLHLKGQYVGGQREGMWMEEIQSQVVGRTHWKGGRPDGVSEQFGVGFAGTAGQRVLLVFSNGRLVSMDGNPVDDRLATLLEHGMNDDTLPNIALHRPGASLQAGPTVRSFIANASAEFDVPMRIDPHYVDYDDKLICNWRELTPAACISAALASGALTCDYRYGCLWVTTEQGLSEWRESTGVRELHPPAGSPIESSWSEAVTFEAEGEGLSRVLNNLGAEVGVTIDTSQLREDVRYADTLVSTEGQRRRFSDILGLILWEKRCRCELRGETLVILPQELP